MADGPTGQRGDGAPLFGDHPDLTPVAASRPVAAPPETGQRDHPPPGKRQRIKQGFTHALRRSRPEEDLLDIEVGRVAYDARQHPMVLARACFETLSVLQLGLIFLYGAPVELGMLMTFLTMASAIIVSGWLYRDRTKWINRALILVLVAYVTGQTAVDDIVVLLMIAAAGRLVSHVVEWARYERLYVTDRRIVQTTGILTRKVSSMPLNRVTDASVKQTLIGEQLGYGSFVLETAGQNQAIDRLDFLIDVRRFNELVLTMATASKAKELKEPEALPHGFLSGDQRRSSAPG